MYLNIGQDTVILDKEILGIFDLDNTTYNVKAAAFINKAEKDGRVVLCTDDLPKSAVLCDKGVYLSQLSSATLRGRAENNSFE